MVFTIPNPVLIPLRLDLRFLFKHRFAEESSVGDDADVDGMALSDLRAIEVDLSQGDVVVRDDSSTTAAEQETRPRGEEEDEVRL